MTIKDIFEVETRNEKNLYDIHFYMEGYFWRAYEWSAYLTQHFPSELDEENKLKVVKKTPNGYDDGYVFVGFQLSSLDKYFPNISNNEETFEMLDKHFIIHAEKYFRNDDFSNYINLLSEWKKNFSANVKEKNKYKYDNKNTDNGSNLNLFVQKIVEYPIENKNLIESVSFLSHIKDEAIKIIKENKMNS